MFVIFRLSIQKEVFPNLLKITNVSSIFKSGNASDVSNYRQISVLPVFSKVWVL